MEKYYYNLLNKQQQSAYHAMKTGLESLAPSFAVPRLEAKELSDIFFKVRLDNPEIFYAESYKYRYYDDSTSIEFVPQYMFDKSKVQEHQKAMKARVEKLANPMMKASELDKLKFIHDFICENVRYDKLKKSYSHEIIGPLGHGVGVCEGIAKSVKILCDKFGIWCIIPISGNNPEKGIKYRHAWNIVKIDGKHYHIDVTFDNSLNKMGEMRYDYFRLSDKQIFNDHEPILYKMPVCEDGEHFYYKDKKLSFTKMEDVQKRAMQAAKKGKILTFHWRGGYMTKEIVREFMDIFEQEAVKKEKHAVVHVNWRQAVVQVAFEKNVQGEQLIMDEANEGETIGEVGSEE